MAKQKPSVDGYFGEGKLVDLSATVARVAVNTYTALGYGFNISPGPTLGKTSLVWSSLTLTGRRAV